MIEYFKTITGSYWLTIILAGTIWVLSGGGILAGINHYFAKIRDADGKAKIAEGQKKTAEEKSLRDAERLAKAEEIIAKNNEEIQRLQPKPFPFRLRQLLEKIDSQIMAGLAQGNTQFEGNLPPFLFTELQSLAAEDAQSKYIKLTVIPFIGFGEAGTFSKVKFELSKALLDTPQK